MNGKCLKMLRTLEAYEEWEAMLIDDNEAWGPEGMGTNPKITNKLWDRLMEIQAMRNEALGRYETREQKTN